ncbi:hypothetical protein Plim_2132 [Planctopirus limnophila DSM 3776]|uniref:Uncharacterized protein n=1 Tax=Planctopirus limnophila (strain ATCC 43296 / DSM 3776 / IFAM 1008 / Mu 290) TaxID=521674 RepID=D5SMQ4_PLAL2|nr:hypothetical protein Plim_2132 [Planctopirus limnophila DSM 3776]
MAKWILTGARDRDVLEAIEKTWPQADPMALVQEAIGGFALSATLSRDAVRGFCFEATRDLYRRMTEIGDFAGALRALKQLADLAA